MSPIWHAEAELEEVKCKFIHISGVEIVWGSHHITLVCILSDPSCKYE